VHAFDPAALATVISEGRTILTGVRRAGEDAERELRFRRRGLAGSMGAILLVVVALVLKIRQIDRRGSES
jgi:hypothetical protein